MNCCDPERGNSVGRPANAGAKLQSALWLCFTLTLLQTFLPGASNVFAGEPVRLTTDGRFKRDPVVVAQGEEIVYAVQETPALFRLMRWKRLDAMSEPLHAASNRSEFEPAVSANGRHLAFVQSRGNLSLALVIRDTQQNKDAEVPPSGGFSGVRSPAFSPDGTRVLYAFPDGSGGRQGIYSVSLQATERKVLIDSDGINNWPSFSPDGKQIVFSSTRAGDYDIYLVNADGTQPRRVVHSPQQDIRPKFSPDGKRIAFVSNRDNNYEIYVINTDGSGLERVTDHPERDDYPAWHPNGRHLVIVSEREGRHDLYQIDVP